MNHPMNFLISLYSRSFICNIKKRRLPKSTNVSFPYSDGLERSTLGRGSSCPTCSDSEKAETSKRRVFGLVCLSYSGGAVKDIYYSGCCGAAGWSDDVIVFHVGTDVSECKSSAAWANNKVACRSHNCYFKAVASVNTSKRHSEIVQKHRGQRCSIFWLWT